MNSRRLLRFLVTCDPAHDLFDFATEVSGRAVYAVFVHRSGPFRVDLAVQREPATNVPG